MTTFIRLTAASLLTASVWSASARAEPEAVPASVSASTSVPAIAAAIAYEPYRGAPPRDEPQTEVLLGGRVVHGGYGAAETRISAVRSDVGVFVGGQGGWVINHHVVLGGAGYGLATRHDTPSSMRVRGEPSTLELGYGGFRAAYLLQPHRLVHVGLGALIGGGGLVARSRHEIMEMDNDGDWDSERRTAHADGVFVLEPEVAVELNVIRFMRIALSGSYRYIGAVDAPGLNSRKLSAPAGSLALKFGAF